MLVAPLAFNSFAAIDLDNLKDPNNWIVSGLVGDELKINKENNSIEAAVGSGVLSQKISLQPGDYKITFGMLDNAKVKIEGVSGLTVNDSSYSFKLASKGEVAIEITAVDASKSFLVAGAQLVLDFDFEAAATTLGNELSGVPELVVSKYGDKSGYVDQKTRLEQEKAAIQGLIDAIGSGSLEIYEGDDYKFYENPSALANRISEYADQVKAYNEAVTAENVIFDKIESNKAAEAALNQGVDNLRKELAATNAEIDKTIEATTNDAIKAALNKVKEKGTAELTEQIDAYEAEIKNAYADPSKDIVFDSKEETISAAIKDYQVKFNTANADQIAYYDMKAKLEAFQNSFNQAMTTLSVLSGVEGQEDVFNSKINEWQESIRKIYEDALAGLNFKEGVIDGYSGDKFTDDSNAVKNATDAINGVVTSASSLVETQNSLMTNASERFGEIQKLIDELNKITIKEVVDEVSDINKEFNDLKTQVNEQYTKHELTEDFATTADDLKTRLETVKKKVQPILDAQKALDEAIEYVNNAIKGTPELTGKFNGTIASIQQGIDDLTLDNNDNVEILSSIETMKANADKLVEVFKEAKAAVTGFEESITELNTLIDEKTIIEGSTFSKDDFKKVDPYKSLEVKRQEFVADLKAAGEAEAQACYDKAVALSAAIAEYDYANVIESVKLDFETKATEANKAVADALLAAVKKNAEGDYTGHDTIDFSKVEADLSTIANEISAAETTSPVNPELFNACDTKIQKAIESINAIQAQVDKLKADDKAYKDFIASTDAVQTLIKEVWDFNGKISLSPAKEYFEGVIAFGETTTEGKSLQAQLNKIVEDLQAALGKTEVVANKSNFESRIEALKTKVNNTEIRISDNETAHNNQLADSKTVRSFILNLIDDINDKDNKDAEFVKTWLETLDDLLTNDLTDLDRKVTNSYAVGESGGENAEIYKNGYKDILAKAEAVQTEFNEKYGDNVAALNNQLIATNSTWMSTLDALRGVYNGAVMEYNFYKYDLTNAGYLAYLKANGLSDHEIIYQYSAKINKLRADVEEYVKEQNCLHHVITTEEFKVNAINHANRLKDEIDGLVSGLTAFVNEQAKNYYVQQYGVEQGNIAYAETTLTEAGVDETLRNEFLDPFKKELADIQTEKDKVVDEPDFGKKMDGIANQLDAIAEVLNMQSVAEKQWKSNYESVTTEFGKLKEELKGYTDADQLIIDEVTKDLGTVEQANSTLDIQAKSYTEDLIQSLKGLTESLNSNLAEAKDLVAEVKASDEANKDLKAKKADFQGKIDTLDEDYTKLVEFVTSLNGTSYTSLDGVSATIDKVKKFYDCYGNMLTIELYFNKISSLVNEATDAITNGYTSARTAEKESIEEYIRKAKVAFNNVKANKLLGDGELNKYNGDIDNAIKGVAALTDMSNADFLNEAKALEAEIATIYQKLQKIWAENNTAEVNPYETAISTLQEKYDEVNAAITSGSEYLEACLDDVKNSEANYGEQYEALQTRLNSLKSEWEAKGDVVIMSQDRYLATMESILEEVNNLGQQVEEAETVAQAEKLRRENSDKQAAVLQTELDSLNESYETLVSTIEGYDEVLNAIDAYEEDVDAVMNQFTSYLHRIQMMIENAQLWLNGQKEEFLLDENTQLRNQQRIVSELNFVSLQAARRYATQSNSISVNEINNAINILANHDINIIKSVREEVVNALDVLETNRQVANGKYSELTGSIVNDENRPVIISQFEALAGTYQGIAENAKKEAEKLVEAEYTPGDVNLDPNGEVTVADVQMVITWVGEGVTLGELPARQAAAADINGDDVLNIADITGIIRLTMDAENGTTGVRYAVSRCVAADQGFISVEAMERENGVRRYAVLLDNNTTFIGGQLDIMLPAGCSVEDVTLGERVQNHNIATFDNVAGRTRVVITSMENAAFDGNQGALIYVDVRGAGTPTVENAIFSDQKCNAIGVNQRGTTAIESIQDGLRNTKDAIYDAAGRAMRSVQRGINIIRHSDGTVTKELNK